MPQTLVAGIPPVLGMWSMGPLEKSRFNTCHDACAQSPGSESIQAGLPSRLAGWRPLLLSSMICSLEGCLSGEETFN